MIMKIWNRLRQWWWSPWDGLRENERPGLPPKR